MTRRRVVITGMGTLNPIANSVPEFWRGLLAGRSGIAPLTLFDASP
ncbi:MAG TPA: beta-ketoacyl synthase N-terminal-like domain-containing protein, partial [Gemmataceae bacterium]